MRKVLNKKSGFTLIELMIVVAILGILAAIAIPAFVTYIRRSKTAEATENIDKLFTAVASYYQQGERQAQGLNGAQFNHCRVATQATTPTPNDTKQLYPVATDFAAGTSFKAVGWQLDRGYYRYSINSTAGGCGTTPNNNDVYTLRAQGDLDNDATLSTFEQAAGSNAENELYRSAGFFVQNETE